MSEVPAEQLGHVPVLAREVLELLAPAAGECALDATAGLGGHAAQIAARLGPTGTLILNDFDPANLDRAAAAVGALPDPPRVVRLRGNFAEAPRKLVEMGLAADVVLADLGFSSNQVDDAARGFSFMRDGPLDMRLDPSAPLTAAELVNTLPERELGEILRDLGEDPHWRRITQKIIAERARGPISTTSALAAIVRSAAGPAGPSRINPATRAFQALRIAVNDELGNLRSLLESVSRAASILRTARSAAPAWLKLGARIGIIAFHSLEDRLVKNAFAELASRGEARLENRKPIEASEQEQRDNPRARSAKLRVVRFAGGPPPPVDNEGRSQRVV
ncbi:MAG: 16S rRNA (cytosine(1402)-N(4))-methyltransferase RsmH [Planctomycetota bacterium]|nr:16S rRNA (cytosine(1402)-N(4))-methyltransferase RsmH [Planctomycetota bacterium]